MIIISSNAVNFGSEIRPQFLKVKPIRLLDTMIFQKIFREKFKWGQNLPASATALIVMIQIAADFKVILKVSDLTV